MNKYFRIYSAFTLVLVSGAVVLRFVCVFFLFVEKYTFIYISCGSWSWKWKYNQRRDDCRRASVFLFRILCTIFVCFPVPLSRTIDNVI